MLLDISLLVYKVREVALGKEIGTSGVTNFILWSKEKCFIFMDVH